ncbi:MAG: GNAT family N-acetyltransferase [Myxococcales bacterium]
MAVDTRQPLIVARPAIDLLASYLQFIEELRLQGDRVWDSMVPLAGEDGAAFVSRLAGAETAAVPPSVATTTYWATIAGTVVGRGALRHVLTQELAEFGGHVSYEVRPSYRRRGVATELLRQILSTAEAQEIGTLLLTCAPTNIGSNRAIRANGGQLVKTSFVARVNRETSYYRIELKSRP